MPDKPKKLTTIRDAQGNRVTQLDPLELKLLHQYDTIDADTLTKILDEIGPGLDDKTRRFLPVLYIGVPIIGIILIVMAIDAVVNGDISILLSPRNIAIGNVWLIVLVLWYRAKEARFGKIKKAMLNHHRCPHCGYNLRDLQPDPKTNHTTCPECGSVWNMPESQGA